MSGILLGLFVSIWVLLVLWVARRLGRLTPSTAWRPRIVTTVVIVGLALPFVGDVIAGVQFSKLCKASTVRLDLSASPQNLVYLPEVKRVPVDKLFLDATEEQWRYLDVQSDRLVVAFEEYRARGGLFFGTIHLFQGGAPLLFKGYCQPESITNIVEYRKRLGLRLMEPEQVKKMREKK